MLQHAASQPAALNGAPMQDVPVSSLPARRARLSSRPTTLVVHSRSHAVRFRILSTHAPATTAMPVIPSPGSFLQGHRMCQKATDCDGDETSDRYQR